MKKKFKLVTKFPVLSYKCGLKVGDRVRLKQDIVIQPGSSLPQKVLKKGGVWRVIAEIQKGSGFRFPDRRSDYG
jgi:hypothetical protein